MAEAGPAQQSRPRYTKGQRTKERIVDSAMDLFSARGYLAVSVRDIAAHAGVTHASVLHYFPDGKGELLLKVLERRDAIDAVTLFDESSSAAQRLRVVVDIVERNARTPGLVSLYAKLSNEATSPDHPAHHYFCRRYEILRDYLTGIFAELLDEDDPAMAAQQLLALMDGLQTQWLLAPDKVDMRTSVASFLSRLGLDATLLARTASA